jgi:predicted lipid-binding transport protein (Tim44 family)
VGALRSHRPYQLTYVAAAGPDAAAAAAEPDAAAAAAGPDVVAAAADAVDAASPAFDKNTDVTRVSFQPADRLALLPPT